MAISLPSVVGEAVCPCVRASIATPACSSASAATASITCTCNANWYEAACPPAAAVCGRGAKSKP